MRDSDYEIIPAYFENDTVKYRIVGYNENKTIVYNEIVPTLKKAKSRLKQIKKQIDYDNV